MPGRNIIKQYGADEFYHVYSRGVAKQPIFLDHDDYVFFQGLFKRYLSYTSALSSAGVAYPRYSKRMELLTFCLMPNHIHLLLYQYDALALAEFMRSLMTSYSMYFNRKYERVGPVFQSRYRASVIDRDNYLEHISRYIHLNPHNWRHYSYSSLAYYMGDRSAEWLRPERVLELFNTNPAIYLEFLQDGEAHKQMMDELKWELAHE